MINSELLSYLQVLSQVQASGHYVNEEIKEVIKVIRGELGLVQPDVKESRYLVYGGRLGHEPTWLEKQLFELAHFKDMGVVYFDDFEFEQAEEAVKALSDMGLTLRLQDNIVVKDYVTTL